MWYFFARLEEYAPDTWVAKGGYQDESDADNYITSLYFAMTSLTTVGYGDISIRTHSEVVMALIWMIFGVFIYSFILGTLTSVLASMDSR
jgi:hypothetical protein